MALVLMVLAFRVSPFLNFQNNHIVMVIPKSNR